MLLSCRMFLCCRAKEKKQQGVNMCTALLFCVCSLLLLRGENGWDCTWYLHYIATFGVRCQYEFSEAGLGCIRLTWGMFQRQQWCNVWETGWSTFGLFRVHTYHLELNWTGLCWSSLSCLVSMWVCCLVLWVSIISVLRLSFGIIACECITVHSWILKGLIHYE